MLNTKMNVISFDNGKFELNDNWIFLFEQSMRPSLYHLASFAIILSYFSANEPSKISGFLKEKKNAHI